MKPGIISRKFKTKHNQSLNRTAYRAAGELVVRHVKNEERIWRYLHTEKTL